MHRPSEPGRFPDLLEAKLCQDRGGKSFKFGILLLYIQGGNKKKFIFPRFRLIAPERKHFHCVVMIGNTCEPHPT